MRIVRAKKEIPTRNSAFIFMIWVVKLKFIKFSLNYTERDKWIIHHKLYAKLWQFILISAINKYSIHARGERIERLKISHFVIPESYQRKTNTRRQTKQTDSRPRRGHRMRIWIWTMNGCKAEYRTSIYVLQWNYAQDIKAWFVRKASSNKATCVTTSWW